VKFHQEGEIRRFVARAVKETLLGFHNAGQSERAQGLPPASKQEALPKLPATLQPLSVELPPKQAPLQMGFASNPASTRTLVAKTPAVMQPKPSEIPTSTPSPLQQASNKLMPPT